MSRRDREARPAAAAERTPSGTAGRVASTAAPPPEPEFPETHEAGGSAQETQRAGAGQAPVAERAPEFEPSPDDRRRGMTIARKQMLRERRRMLAEGALPVIIDYDRPRSRSQCRDGQRPCLYVACRYHLYLDVNPQTGSIKINFPGRAVHELEETCALDVAERGGVTLEEVGAIMNLTRERIRQVESSGLDKIRQDGRELDGFLDDR